MKWIFLSLLMNSASFADDFSIPALPSADTAKLEAKKEREERPLFRIEKNDGKYVLFLREDQLDHPFLLATTIESGVPVDDVDSGYPLSNFLVDFHRNGDAIELRKINLIKQSADGTDRAVATQRAYQDSILAAAPILNPVGKHEILMVPVAELFKTDVSNFASYVASKVPLKSDRMAIEFLKIESFPKNAHYTLSFKLAVDSSTKSVKNAGIPDSRSTQFVVGYDILQLPENDHFTPRPADPRVGYFTTLDRNLGDPDLDGAKARRFIYRRGIVPPEPTSQIKKVENPIVYTIDESVPKQYRQAVEAGVLAWNEVFRSFGLDGAIIVRNAGDMSDAEKSAYSPFSAAYNVVRWLMSRDESAMADQAVDPRTGQIISASVIFCDGYARTISNFKISWIAQGGDLREVDWDKVMQYHVAHVIMHEIGHTLGLRHNFKASANPNGLSIMDYPPLLIDPSTKLPTRIEKPGPYDYQAIQYGYAPLPLEAGGQKAMLGEIASQMLAFGDDDDIGRQGTGWIDPDVNRWDMGRPIEFARTLARYGRTVIDRVARENFDVDPGDSLNWAFIQFNKAVQYSSHYLGGIRSDRTPKEFGGPHRQIVPHAEQTESLQFIAREILAPGKLDIPKELILKASPNPILGVSDSPLVDPNVAASKVQKKALDEIFDTDRLSRVITQKSVDPQSLPLKEVFDTIRSAVWPNSLGRISPQAQVLARQLQVLHAEKLRTLSSDENIPVRELARHDLRTIHNESSRRLKLKNLPMEERAHWEYVLELTQPEKNGSSKK